MKSRAGSESALACMKAGFSAYRGNDRTLHFMLVRKAHARKKRYHGGTT